MSPSVRPEEPDERTPSALRSPPWWHRLRFAARRRNLGTTVVAATVALLLGLALGRSVASGIAPEDRALLEGPLAMLVLDADVVWTAGSGDRPGVAEGLQRLRRDDDPAAITRHARGWLEAYDTVLLRLSAVEVAPELRPIQRQFINSVMLTRDAVEVLLAAAESRDPVARRDLSSEALRLRARAEHLNQAARASLDDLAGAGSGVTVPPRLPRLDDLR